MMITKLISIKYCIIYLLLTSLIVLHICFAKTKGSSITNCFIKDNYGTSFYYDEDKYYNNGWHLIDDNGDGVYEYYYFSLSGHMFKNTIAPNGHKLNPDGKLIINDLIYQVNFLDVANSDTAIFINKIETTDEIVKGFEIDYNQVFAKWYEESKTDITNQLNTIANDLTIQRVNKVRDEISKKVKECKNIGSWYNDRLYSAKKSEVINKDTHKIISRKLQKDMSEYINRFREEMGNIIKSMGY